MTSLLRRNHDTNRRVIAGVVGAEVDVVNTVCLLAEDSACCQQQPGAGEGLRRLGLVIWKFYRRWRDPARLVSCRPSSAIPGVAALQQVEGTRGSAAFSESDENGSLT